jgi:hypothetical protein
MATRGRAAHFIIAAAGNGGFVCTLVTENGTELLISNPCASAAEAAAVAALIKSHAGVLDRYSRHEGDGGALRFHLHDDTGKLIARSLTYSTRLARELALERTMASAPSAPIFGD